MAKSQELHIFFFPLMAPGHLIPMINLANLFALHGAKTTILTTPKCTSLIQNQINRFHLSGHSINLLVLSSSAKGNENLTSPELSTCFLKAMDDLHKPFDQALKEHQPNCVVTDMYLPWTQEIASQNSIPRLLFHTMGYFALSVIDTLDNHATNGCVNVDQDEMVMVHGLPHLLQMKKSQLHDTLVVDVLGVGVKVGVQEWGMREEGKEVIGRDVVERGVRRVMDEGEEKQRLGERVNSMKEKARRAVEKGGSSCVEMERLMQEICAWRS
ncbi:UDP-glycosyltransferase 73B5 [Rhynchospora pubera]|uniref:UDP-glycosyltransferase 73B5 n=1 Tax=Rhynchospora pubera TaxID=906938 RepID=A0AAV8FA67_9POAL|nr:UDP-glycosyltransferase 73B5 [Rhynchospora pubera]